MSKILTLLSVATLFGSVIGQSVSDRTILGSLVPHLGHNSALFGQSNNHNGLFGHETNYHNSPSGQSSRPDTISNVFNRFTQMGSVIRQNLPNMFRPMTRGYARENQFNRNNRLSGRINNRDNYRQGSTDLNQRVPQSSYLFSSMDEAASNVVPERSASLPQRLHQATTQVRGSPNHGASSMDEAASNVVPERSVNSPQRVHQITSQVRDSSHRGSFSSDEAATNIIPQSSVSLPQRNQLLNRMRVPSNRGASSLDGAASSIVSERSVSLPQRDHQVNQSSSPLNRGTRTGNSQNSANLIEWGRQVLGQNVRPPVSNPI